jgi:hypothetical protein
VLWKRRLGAAPAIEDVWANCTAASPCISPAGLKNMRGHVGVVGTPAVDRARRIVFVVSRALIAQKIVYRIHALDLTTGVDLAGSPQVIEASGISGVNFEPSVQNQRPGLALARGQVIVAFGAHEDFLKYHGWVMSFRYDSSSGFARTGVFVTTPGGSTDSDCASKWPKEAWTLNANNCAHGGIWMSGRAPVVDADGRVLLMIGNGTNDMTSTMPRNFGNSLVALNPVTLAPLDFFTPENHLTINAADLDFGGSGPMAIPGSDLIIGGGKEGVMHVWHRGNLGQFRPDDPFVVQKFPAGDVKLHEDTGNDMPGGAVIGGIMVSDHAGHIMGGPTYWPRAGGGLMFNWSENAQLRAYAMDVGAPQPFSSPVAMGPDFQAGHPGGILAISANGAKRGSGIVWASTYDADGTWELGLGITGALHNVVHGTLRAYAADDVGRRLWTSDDNAGRDGLGSFAKFNPPTVANGRVYMATFSNEVVAYGLLHHHYARPVAQSIVPILEALLDDED